MSDLALIAAHTRGLYLVQRGNREQRYSVLPLVQDFELREVGFCSSDLRGGSGPDTSHVQSLIQSPCSWSPTFPTSSHPCIPNDTSHCAPHILQSCSYNSNMSYYVNWRPVIEIRPSSLLPIYLARFPFYWDQQVGFSQGLCPTSQSSLSPCLIGFMPAWYPVLADWLPKPDCLEWVSQFESSPSVRYLAQTRLLWYGDRVKNCGGLFIK